LILRFFVFFPELVYAAFSVDELLFAGEEGVADGADVEPHGRFRGPGLERFTAGAVDFRQFVVGMDILFHNSPPILSVNGRPMDPDMPD
jgi:hypothetical protein